MNLAFIMESLQYRKNPSDMKPISSQSEYQKCLVRMEALLKIVDNETAPLSSDFIELDQLSDRIAHYEERHYPFTA